MRHYLFYELGIISDVVPIIIENLDLKKLLFYSYLLCICDINGLVGDYDDTIGLSYCYFYSDIGKKCDNVDLELYYYWSLPKKEFLD